MTRASWWQNLAGFAAVTIGCILLALAGAHHEQVAPVVGYGGGLVIGLGVPGWWVWRVFTEHHDVEVKR